MSDQQENDSLLQDASTLLMFASAAAKQQQEKSPAVMAVKSPPAAVASKITQSPPPVPSLPPLSSIQPASGLSQYHFPKPMNFEPLVPLNQYSQLPHISQLPLFKSDHREPTLANVLAPALPLHTDPRPVQVKIEPFTKVDASHPATAPPSTRHSSSSSTSDVPKPGHKRTQSVPETKESESKLSPGPASVVLSRGIDPHTGRPNNSNAVIAAAALAQAADNPLPLLKRELKAAAETGAVAPEPQEPLPVKPRSIQPNFVAPPLASYQVDPDAGVIGCICGIEDDDGFTIQCDICFRWQHCVCMDFSTNEEVPEDEYKCYYCDQEKWGKFDAEACRNNTIARLEKEANDKVRDNKRKRKQAASGENKAEERKKKRSESSDKTKEKKAAKEEQEEPEAAPDDYEPDFIPNLDNELLEEGVSAENYQATYYNSRTNDYKDHALQNKFGGLGSRFMDGYSKLDDESKASFPLKVLAQAEFKAIPLVPIMRPNLEKYRRKHNEPVPSVEVAISVKPYSDTQKQRFNGISKLGLFLGYKAPAEDDGGPTDEETTEKNVVIPKGTPIIEYFGVIDLFVNYRENPTNKYATLGTTKPKVLKTKLPLIDQDLDLVLDSRFVGNESRFIRKSCSPAANCEVRPYYIPETSSFRFLVFTSKDITLSEVKTDEELRLPWEWHEMHPMRKLLGDESAGTEGMKFDQLSEREKSVLISGIDNLLYFAECGCTSTSNMPAYLPQCGLFKVKKAISYLLRSTRKTASISNLNLYKPKEELVVPRKIKKFVSWKDRLYERDRIIQASLFLTIPENDQEVKLEDVVAKESEIMKEAVLPLRQRLLQKANISELKADGSTSVEVNLNEFIPLTKQMQLKIKKSVDDKVQVAPEVKETIAEISQKLHDKPEILIKAETNVVTEKSVSATPEASVPVKQEAKEETAHPVAKKKLSFADYKKKMK